jgi:hypothetical protein
MAKGQSQDLPLQNMSHDFNMSIHIQGQHSLNAMTDETLVFVGFSDSESLAAFAVPIGRLACPG